MFMDKLFTLGWVDIFANLGVVLPYHILYILCTFIIIHVNIWQLYPNMRITLKVIFLAIYTVLASFNAHLFPNGREIAVIVIDVQSSRYFL